MEQSSGADLYDQLIQEADITPLLRAAVDRRISREREEQRTESEHAASA